MATEETEAIWAKLSELEQAVVRLGKSNLEVAREVTASEILSDYHLIVTMFLAVKSDKGAAYVKYMHPRCEAAQEAVRSAPNMEQAFKIAADFHNDCFNYLKSQL